jgi:hypothetical protein
LSAIESSRTFSEELLHSLCCFFENLVESALDLSDNPLELRNMLMLIGMRLLRFRILTSNILDSLDEPSVLTKGISVKLTHVRTASDKLSQYNCRPKSVRGAMNVLFHTREEPPATS